MVSARWPVLKWCVRSGSAHDEGCLSHLKNCRNPNCDFRGRLKTK